jgi:hypothetical protein
MCVGQMGALLPPLWGKAGMGGRADALNERLRSSRRGAARPPTLTLPHKGRGDLPDLRSCQSLARRRRSASSCRVLSGRARHAPDRRGTRAGGGLFPRPLILSVSGRICDPPPDGVSHSLGDEPDPGSGPRQLRRHRSLTIGCTILNRQWGRPRGSLVGVGRRRPPRRRLIGLGRADFPFGAVLTARAAGGARPAAFFAGSNRLIRGKPL